MDPFVIATAVIPPLLTLLFGFWLGKARDSEKVIFNKKLEIYSDIVYHLSSAKYLQLNLHFAEEKLKALVKELDLLKEGRSVVSKEHTFDTELETVDRKLRQLDYRDELIKLFAPARLVGSEAVVNELREYYSLMSEYHVIEQKKDLDDLTKKISKSVMELEQLMRKDLGRSRLISRLDIWWHLHKK
jgi:hypothetical protein